MQLGALLRHITGQLTAIQTNPPWEMVWGLISIKPVRIQNDPGMAQDYHKPASHINKTGATMGQPCCSNADHTCPDQLHIVSTPFQHHPEQSASPLGLPLTPFLQQMGLLVTHSATCSQAVACRLPCFTSCPAAFAHHQLTRPTNALQSSNWFPPQLVVLP